MRQAGLSERHDCEPHRGDFLWLLGTASLVCGVLSCFLLLPGLVGLPLGVATLAMARRDLGRMKAGRLDPTGRERTEWAQNNARVGVGLSLTGIIFTSLFILALRGRG
jgi:hypothetical protein